MFKFEIKQVVKTIPVTPDADGVLAIVMDRRTTSNGVNEYVLEALESDDVMPRATENALEVVTDDETGAILFVANKEDIPADAVIKE
ncbi:MULTISPECIES: hypothetical protein [Citrobacter]|uniref:hypothetical protein n=1 Tax=Citrobacter TaxID=544 RepID=UPI00115E3827|nr:hypothetical protein [Citrobacter sp. FDAARGOS_156]MBJ8926179.1 hypothetical protein [Citrobacter sp. FDAARGOS_156]TRL64834.1 hypothetical protein FMM65_20460 [Citrobacter youngae]